MEVTISIVLKPDSSAGGKGGKESQRRGHLSWTLKNQNHARTYHATKHLLHWIISERDWYIDDTGLNLTLKTQYESWKQYAEWKKPDKRIYSVWFHLCKILKQTKPSCSDRKRISCCQGRRWGDWLQRGMSDIETSGVTEKFSILIVLVVTQVCAFVKTPTAQVK